jgi:hypothetical protein
MNVLEECRKPSSIHFDVWVDIFTVWQLYPGGKRV